MPTAARRDALHARRVHRPGRRFGGACNSRSAHLFVRHVQARRPCGTGRGLLLRHEELQRTALLEQQLAAVTHERDNLRSRLNAARGRIDALLERLPKDGRGRADGRRGSARREAGRSHDHGPELHPRLPRRRRDRCSKPSASVDREMARSATPARSRRASASPCWPREPGLSAGRAAGGRLAGDPAMPPRRRHRRTDRQARSSPRRRRSIAVIARRAAA